jgi:hypothetical protein
MFTSELTIDVTSMRANNLDSIYKDRADLMCKICSKNGGACIQCSVKKCLESFHPYCAFKEHYQLIIRSEQDNGYEVYCKKHKNNVRNIETITSARNPIISKIAYSTTPMTISKISSKPLNEDLIFVSEEKKIASKVRKRLIKNNQESNRKKRTRLDSKSTSIYSKLFSNPDVKNCFELEAVVSGGERYLLFNFVAILFVSVL